MIKYIRIFLLAVLTACSSSEDRRLDYTLDFAVKKTGLLVFSPLKRLHFCNYMYFFIIDSFSTQKHNILIITSLNP